MKALPKFSGKERDAESGLDYFGARYYDRSQYRFISVDPTIILERAIAMPQMWNLYSYCGNNPITYLDPSGRWWTVEVHGIYTMKIALYAHIPNSIARSIAIADMNVDLDFGTSSTQGGLFSREVRQYWHFPTQEQLENARLICKTTLNPKVLGMYLHVIQDSYSHQGFEYDHMADLSIDNPNSNWSTTMDMAMETLQILTEFYQRYCNYMIEVAQSALLGICQGMI